MRAKRSLRNIISAILFRCVTIILGFIVPRLTLNNYGSEINGFMSLVAQIYSYIALLEAGLGVTAIQALYYPISKGDKNEISGIVNAAKKYYSKIALYYSSIVLISSIIFPFVLKTEIGREEVFAYFLIFGVSNVINFLVTAAYMPLLNAEGKNYVSSNIGMIFHIILQLAKILMLSMSLNIVILQSVYSAINIVQVAVYFIYFRKNYRWIDKRVPPLFEKLKQRGAFFIQQISDLVFSCTDVVIISTFCNLKITSVYTVYMMIYGAIQILVSNIASGTQFILGQTYAAGNKEKYLMTHRVYESVLVTVSSIIYTSLSLLTIPFLKIYTNGITDANYIDFILPLMLSANGILITYKIASIYLINFSFNAKNAMPRTVLEAVINLILTLIFVPIWGIRGALLGTGAALLYRVVDLLFYANKKILKTSARKPAILYISNFFVFLIVYAIGTKISYTANTYFDLLIHGAFVVIISALIFCGVNFLIDVEQAKSIYKYAYAKIKILKQKHLKGEN